MMIEVQVGVAHVMTSGEGRDGVGERGVEANVKVTDTHTDTDRVDGVVVLEMIGKMNVSVV